MTKVVGSLFGISPEQLMAQREAALFNQAGNFAQLDPMQRATAGAFMAGRKMVDGAAGLLGAQDPELARLAQRQSIASQIDWADPESIKRAAALAARNGDTAAAMDLIQRADDVVESKLKQGVYQSQIVKNMREKQSLSVEEQVFKSLAVKASPASVKAAIEAGGDISLLDVPVEEKLSTTGRMLLEAGVKPGTPEFVETMKKVVNAEIEGKSKGSGNVTVHNNMPGAPIDGKKAAEAAGTETGKQMAGVETEWAALDSLQSALTKVDQGIFGGIYGKGKLLGHKLAGSNDPRVVNTEEFLAYIGDTVLPAMKQLGGNDSNEELKYMQKVHAGDISLEPETIRRVLSRAEEKIKRRIQRLQDQSKSAAQGTPAPLGPGSRREFKSVQEAEAAKLPKGTQIIINGRRAVVE
jgi:hypothetical protein